jgi:hypothetical protein
MNELSAVAPCSLLPYKSGHTEVCPEVELAFWSGCRVRRRGPIADRLANGP